MPFFNPFNILKNFIINDKLFVSYYLRFILILNFVLIYLDFIFSFDINVFDYCNITNIVTLITSILTFISQALQYVFTKLVEDIAANTLTLKNTSLEFVQKELYGFGPNSEMLPKDSEFYQIPHWYYVYKLHILGFIFIFFISILFVLFNFKFSIVDKIIYLLCLFIYFIAFLYALNAEQYLFYEKVITFLVSTSKTKLVIVFYDLLKYFFDPYFTLFIYFFLTLITLFILIKLFLRIKSNSF